MWTIKTNYLHFKASLTFENKLTQRNEMFKNVYVTSRWRHSSAPLNSLWRHPHVGRTRLFSFHALLLARRSRGDEEEEQRWWRGCCGQHAGKRQSLMFRAPTFGFNVLSLVTLPVPADLLEVNSSSSSRSSLHLLLLLLIL